MRRRERFIYSLFLILTMLKTIKIKEKTHKRLTELGKKGETFSDLIDRIIDENAKKRI